MRASVRRCTLVGLGQWRRLPAFRVAARSLRFLNGIRTVERLRAFHGARKNVEIAEAGFGASWLPASTWRSPGRAAPPARDGCDIGLDLGGAVRSAASGRWRRRSAAARSPLPPRARRRRCAARPATDLVLQLDVSVRAAPARRRRPRLLLFAGDVGRTAPAGSSWRPALGALLLAIEQVAGIVEPRGARAVRASASRAPAVRRRESPGCARLRPGAGYARPSRGR